ncbi:NUDIX domain-containing protein [Frankia sp. AgPm24]|uniref:NUDIX domain-containing protein n=1 Tax=Frankia sp. AgPm24 TaxID=631128 RepID=UPI0035B03F50
MELPSGKVDPGESLDEALAREVKARKAGSSILLWSPGHGCGQGCAYGIPGAADRVDDWFGLPTPRHS